MKPSLSSVKAALRRLEKGNNQPAPVDAGFSAANERVTMESQQLNEKLNQLREDDKAFFERAFEGMTVPADIRRLSERICRAYGINGLCDPAYIANVIAVEMGRGNGLSVFTDAALTPAQHNAFPKGRWS